jgi:uncharacterized protein YjiS (DUF1127 family)
MAYISNISTTKSTAGSVLRRWYETFVQNRANYRMYARTLRELNALSDRELADLGLSRSSLNDVARSAVYTD